MQKTKYKVLKVMYQNCPLGKQEVMPMTEHSSNMGLLVDDSQLRAGAVL
ncbi:MAG: hypothetical protein AAFR62_11085 [Cyanobacteria bacterium J06629_2]